MKVKCPACIECQVCQGKGWYMGAQIDPTAPTERMSCATCATIGRMTLDGLAGRLAWNAHCTVCTAGLTTPEAAAAYTLGGLDG